MISGCATTTTISQPQPASVANKVQVGDSVSIELKGGAKIRLYVTEIGTKSLSGVSSGQKMTIPYDTMKAVSLKRTDGAKTAALVLAITAVGALLLITVMESLTLGGS